MAVVRDFSLGERERERAARVIEPELDMNRTRRPQASAVGRIFDLLRWLTTMGGPEIVGPPRRSVGREVEEAWPSFER